MCVYIHVCVLYVSVTVSVCICICVCVFTAYTKTSWQLMGYGEDPGFQFLWSRTFLSNVIYWILVGFRFVYLLVFCTGLLSDFSLSLSVVFLLVIRILYKVKNRLFNSLTILWLKIFVWLRLLQSPFNGITTRKTFHWILWTVLGVL